MEGLAESFIRLKDSDIRVVVLGIGVQMNWGESVSRFVANLSVDGHLLSLKIMSEHSVKIGVRGQP